MYLQCLLFVGWLWYFLSLVLIKKGESHRAFYRMHYAGWGAIAFEFKKQVSLIGNRYKIYSKNAGKKYELYDIVSDPAEKKNLAKAHPEKVKTLRAQLEAWRQSCAASRSGTDY